MHEIELLCFIRVYGRSTPYSIIVEKFKLKENSIDKLLKFGLVEKMYKEDILHVIVTDKTRDMLTAFESILFIN